MEDDDTPIIIGCDLAATEAAFSAACIRGKAVQVLIFDDLDPEMPKRIQRAIKGLLEHDLSELEQRLLDTMEEITGVTRHEHFNAYDFIIPRKAAEEPVPKHDPHPQAKAKLPFYHQRRRF